MSSNAPSRSSVLSVAGSGAGAAGVARAWAAGDSTKTTEDDDEDGATAASAIAWKKPERPGMLALSVVGCLFTMELHRHLLS